MYGLRRYRVSRERVKRADVRRRRAEFVFVIQKISTPMFTCTRILVVFFLRAHLFVLAPLSETSDGVGTTRPLGSCYRRFGRDPCSVSLVASPLKLFGLGHTYGKSPGFRNIPVDWVSASPLPVYARKILMQPGFSARRGYTYISLFLHRAPRYDPAAQHNSPAA